MKIVINGKTVEALTGGSGTAEEIYSTEETRIGTWIDGKPLYRRSLPITTPPSSQSGKWTVVNDTVIENVDGVTHLYGIVLADGRMYHSVPNEFLSLIWERNRGKLMMLTSAAAFFSVSGVCIIEYTKTTDAATKTVAVPLSTMTIETPSYQSAAASTVTTKFEA